jgi:hypothetical protein
MNQNYNEREREMVTLAIISSYLRWIANYRMIKRAYGEGFADTVAAGYLKSLEVDLSKELQQLIITDDGIAFII